MNNISKIFTNIGVRIARLESHIEYIKRDLADIKMDLHIFEKLYKNDFGNIQKDIRTDFRIIFITIIIVALGLAALMAKGFHWI